ncbi:hypothetical protein BGZ89_002011 [Linnemannia elongata]|nr:hypothetical protein BGZ89_002011 [Linnemannia elongata]
MLTPGATGPRRSNESVKKPVKPAPPILAAPSVLVRNGSAPTQTSYLPSASKGYLLQPIQTPHLSSVSKRYIPKSIENPDLISASKGSMNKPAETAGKLQKRSRWALNAAKMLSVWPSNTKITYGVWAENKYLPQVGGFMGLTTSAPDKDSIMNWAFKSSATISKTDCRAMEFYAREFKTPLNCGVVGGKPEKCKPMMKDIIKPKEVVLPRENPQYKQLPRDELLVDIDDLNCLGADISKYFIISANDYGGGFGGFGRGMLISQCLAVRVASNPNFFYAMQSDGNFVSYNSKTGQAVWSTGSQGLVTKGGYNMLFQQDGNLVIYDISGEPIWASSTYDGSPDTFRIKTHYWQFHDGHMFISDEVGRAAWGSFPSIARNNVIIWLRNQLGGPSNYCLDAWENKSGYPTKLNAWNGKGGQLWNVFTDGTIRNMDTNQFYMFRILKTRA